MRAEVTRQTIRISEPDPFGDVTLAPEAATGLSEAQLARSMAEALIEAAPASSSETLKLLRKLFPNSPLTARVAALGALMRR